jgi:hypothetical protein
MAPPAPPAITCEIMPPTLPPFDRDQSRDADKSEVPTSHRNSAVLGYVMPYSGHRSAPFMLTAFAGVVHERQGADG